MITEGTKPGKGFRRSISKQIASQDRLQSVTEAGYDGGEPPRRTHERLGPWLKLANLLLPPPSRDEQQFLVLDPIERWRAQCRAIRTDEFVHRFMRSRLAQAPAITATVDLQLLLNDPDQARRFLDLVGEIASVLQTLVAATSPKVLKALGEEPLLIERRYETPATSRSELWMCKGAVITCLVDPFKDFLAALNGVEAVRVRQCPMCSRFFYALRKDQKACSTRCNAARRVRDWRANQARHEYRRKLRPAGLLAQRRGKPRK